MCVGPLVGTNIVFVDCIEEILILIRFLFLKKRLICESVSFFVVLEGILFRSILKTMSFQVRMKQEKI